MIKLMVMMKNSLNCHHHHHSDHNDHHHDDYDDHDHHYIYHDHHHLELGQTSCWCEGREGEGTSSPQEVQKGSSWMTIIMMIMIMNSNMITIIIIICRWWLFSLIQIHVKWSQPFAQCAHRLKDEYQDRQVWILLHTPHWDTFINTFSMSKISNIQNT